MIKNAHEKHFLTSALRLLEPSVHVLVHHRSFSDLSPLRLQFITICPFPFVEMCSHF